MKRFIDLRGQILTADDEPNFAFFCTVIDRFETFADTQEWRSLDEFIEDYKDEEKHGTYLSPLERYLGLIPANYFGPEVNPKVNNLTNDRHKERMHDFKVMRLNDFFKDPIPVLGHFNCSGKYIWPGEK